MTIIFMDDNFFYFRFLFCFLIRRPRTKIVYRTKEMMEISSEKIHHLHDHDLGDGLNEILSKAIGIRALGRDHEHVANTYVLAEVAVSPYVMGGAQRTEDVAGLFCQGRPRQIQDGKIIGFKTFPADGVRAGICDDQIGSLFVDHGH